MSMKFEGPGHTLPYALPLAAGLLALLFAPAVGR